MMMTRRRWRWGGQEHENRESGSELRTTRSDCLSFRQLYVTGVCLCEILAVDLKEQMMSLFWALETTATTTVTDRWRRKCVSFSISRFLIFSSSHLFISFSACFSHKEWEKPESETSLPHHLSDLLSLTHTFPIWWWDADDDGLPSHHPDEKETCICDVRLLPPAEFLRQFRCLCPSVSRQKEKEEVAGEDLKRGRSKLLLVSETWSLISIRRRVRICFADSLCPCVFLCRSSVKKQRETSLPLTLVNLNQKIRGREEGNY